MEKHKTTSVIVLLLTIFTIIISSCGKKNDANTNTTSDPIIHDDNEYITQEDHYTMILQNPLVQTTYAYIQLKHNNGCSELNKDSINGRCTGLLPDVIKHLTLYSSGCGFAVQIICPEEITYILGDDMSIYALDAFGHRKDIEPIRLGISFKSIYTVPNNNQ